MSKQKYRIDLPDGRVAFAATLEEAKAIEARGVRKNPHLAEFGAKLAGHAKKAGRKVAAGARAAGKQLRPAGEAIYWAGVDTGRSVRRAVEHGVVAAAKQNPRRKKRNPYNMTFGQSELCSEIAQAINEQYPHLIYDWEDGTFARGEPDSGEREFAAFEFGKGRHGEDVVFDDHIHGTYFVIKGIDELSQIPDRVRTFMQWFNSNQRLAEQNPKRAKRNPPASEHHTRGRYFLHEAQRMPTSTLPQQVDALVTATYADLDLKDAYPYESTKAETEAAEDLQQLLKRKIKATKVQNPSASEHLQRGATRLRQAKSLRGEGSIRLAFQAESDLKDAEALDKAREAASLGFDRLSDHQGIQNPRRNGKRNPRPPAGTPTGTNLFVLARTFEHADTVSDRFPATSIPHLRRLLAAGLIVGDAKAKTISITAAGKVALREYNALREGYGR